MKFKFREVPDGVRLVHALNHTKINGTASEVNLEDPELFEKMQKLGWRMIKTCVVDSGIGLAAPQLGIPKRVFVTVDFEKPHVWQFKDTFSMYINPEFKPVKGTTRSGFPEGCLSVPGKNYTIMRPREIDVTYWYFTEKGKLKQGMERLEGYPARVFQHENDHLNGMDIVELYKRQNGLVKPKKKRKKNK